MVGIQSFGVYIPFNRLSRNCIAQAFGKKAKMGGEKAVAGYDEDSITMAVTAAIDCCNDSIVSALNGVYLASTTLPYKEKLCATVVAAALNMNKSVRACDFSSSLRCGSSALLTAFDAATNGESILVAVADNRTAFADGENELLFGDGAAAFVVGSNNMMAELTGKYSVSVDFHDQWRSEGEHFVKSWEERYVITQQYMKVMQEAATCVMEQTGLSSEDFASVVIYAHEQRYQQELAKILGFRAEQVQDNFILDIGNTGAACAPIMLCAALEKANPGDRILYLGYGEGCDAIVLTATDAITGRPVQMVRQLARKRNTMNYETYLRWRRLLATEPQRRPPQARVSLPAYYRNFEKNFALYGTRCTECGTPQFPGSRICVQCHTKDKNEPYRFFGKKATIATYAVDHVSASEDPPNLIVVVDFEGGGRMFCNLVDCEPEEIRIGANIALVFRLLHVTDGIHTYFWKAALASREAGEQNGDR